MSTCKTLQDYAVYVNTVRKYAKELPLEQAVEKAIEECVKNDVLAEFLKKNRSEAKAMSIYEYDEEKRIQKERQDAREEGIEEGIEQGIEQGIYYMVATLKKLQVATDVIIEELMNSYQLTKEEAGKYC